MPKLDDLSDPSVFLLSLGVGITHLEVERVAPTGSNVAPIGRVADIVI